MLKFDHKRKDYFLKRIQQHPEDANAYNSLGNIYWLEGEYQQAIKAFGQAVKLNPDFANASANLAQVYSEAGMFDEAVDQLMELKEVNPARSVLSFIAGQLNIVYLKRKLQYQPESSSLHQALSDAYAATGDTPKAVRAMREAAQLSEGDPNLYARLAGMYENLELVDRALETYQTLAELVPDNQQVKEKVQQFVTIQQDRTTRQQWLNSNEVILADERVKGDHLVTCYEAAKQWNDFEFEGRVRTENLRKAAGLFLESIQAKPDDAHAYAEAALIHELLGEYLEAASIWRRGLDAVPGDQVATNNVRRLELLDQVEKGQLPASRKAQSLTEIGTLYRLNGEIEMAIRFFEKSLAEDPDHLSAWVNLASNLVDAGRFEDALSAYQRVRELEPDEQRAAAIGMRISELRQIVQGTEPAG